MAMFARALSVFLLAGLAFGLPFAHGDDWPRFRGADGAGIGTGSLPTELNVEKNLRWKSECGLGASSPVCIAGKVFVTSYEADDRRVECFSTATGERLWVQSIRKARQEHSTPPGGPASSTPVVDHAHVFAFFPDAGLLCYSHEGQLRWQTDLGPFESFHGVSASLVLAAGRVILQADQLQDSFLAAYDAETGREAWRTKRQDGPVGGYSTPSTRTTSRGATELVVSGPAEVVGYDAATGQRNWTVPGVANAPVSIPLVAEEQVFVCEPSFTQNPFPLDALKRHDKNQDGMIGLDEVQTDPPLRRIVRLVDVGFGNGDGQVTAEEMDKAFQSFVGGGGLVALKIDEAGQQPQASVKWSFRRTVPQIPSLLVQDNAVFAIADGGILTTFDLASGETFKRARLDHGAKHYASPVAAGGRILLLDTEGKAAVVSAARDWQVLGTSDLKDRFYATPAIADGGVFLRGAKQLYRFDQPG